MTRRAFQPGAAGKVWVGDLLYRHTRRVKGRGWWHQAEHRPAPGRRAVDELQEALRPKPSGDMIRLGSVFTSVKFFGIVPDSDGTTEGYATIELANNDEPVLTIAALAGPPETPQ